MQTTWARCNQTISRCMLISCHLHPGQAWHRQCMPRLAETAHLLCRCLNVGGGWRDTFSHPTTRRLSALGSHEGKSLCSFELIKILRHLHLILCIVRQILMLHWVNFIDFCMKCWLQHKFHKIGSVLPCIWLTQIFEVYHMEK